MTVLIADGDKAYRTFIRLVMEWETSLKVVAETAGGEEAVRLSRQFRPDLVFMNTGWPRPDGLEIIRRLKAERHGPKVIALSIFEGQEYRKAAASHGADGFLPKHAPLSQIVSIVRAAASLIDAERHRSLAMDGAMDLAAANA